MYVALVLTQHVLTKTFFKVYVYISSFLYINMYILTENVLKIYIDM